MTVSSLLSPQVSHQPASSKTADFAIKSVESPAPRQAWLDLLTKDSAAMPYQRPEMIDVISAETAYSDASRLYTLSDGHQLLLPLLRKGKGWTATYIGLPSDWGGGGVLCSRALTSADITLMMADLAALPALRIILQSSVLRGTIWREATLPKIVRTKPTRGHVVDLRGGYDAVYARYNRFTRRQIKKSEKKQVRVTEGSTDQNLDPFCTLIESSMHRWSEQQNEPFWLTRWRHRHMSTRTRFESMVRHFAPYGVLWMARDGENRPAAACIEYADSNAHGIRLVMDKEIAGPIGAVDALLNTILQDACERGLNYFDLGESGDSPTLAHYKERFGGVAHEYDYFYIERLPIFETDRLIRTVVKRVIGFKDTKQVEPTAERKTE